jgi:fatty-acyl-CoA synthase
LLPQDFIDPVGRGAALSPDKRACLALPAGRSTTYAELDRAVARCAGHLLGRLDPGARVALLARNSLHHLVLFYACRRAGLVFLPLNWRLSPEELGRMLDDAGAALLACEAEFDSPRLAAPDRAVLAVEALQAAAGAARPAADGPPPEPDAPFVLLYTSGATGAPKGVTVTWAGAAASAANFAAVAGLGPASTLLVDTPMFHTVGLIASMHGTLSAGGALVLSDRFEPGRTLARLADPALGVTHYFCVPQMARALRDDPAYDPAPLRRLAGLFTGGAAMPPALTLAFLDDRVTQPNGYGMSEAGTVLGMPLDAAVCRAKAGASGLPAPSVEIRLVHEGRDVADGAVGEIWLRGPAVTPGYWNRPQATAAAFADGWFRTGDLARRDADGFYFVVDRLKDMYISGGENVYPAEIEAALLQIPGVADAAVVGAPDPRWGECGHAFLVREPGAGVDVAAVRAFCSGRLARFKHPAYVHFLDALPRTASGKLRKAELKRRLESEGASS